MNLFWAFPHVEQKFHGNGSETSTRLLTEKNSCKLRLGWVNQLWWFKYLQISTDTKLVWKFPWRIRRIWKMGNYVSKETCCHLSIWLPIWFYNIHSQCGCLEDYFPFGMAYFQGSSGSLIFDPLRCELPSRKPLVWRVAARRCQRFDPLKNPACVCICYIYI